jgi:hypothetical protein
MTVCIVSAAAVYSIAKKSGAVKAICSLLPKKWGTAAIFLHRQTHINVKTERMIN